MKPTIILDKSTLQSIGHRGIHELRRYFYVTIAPPLLHEVLADLEKASRKQRTPQEEVQVLARKLFALSGDAFVNVDFRSACIDELLGGSVPMDRKAIVEGGRRVRTKDGRHGCYLPRQPAMEAAMRWSHGQFSKSDQANAKAWRKHLESYDPDSFRRSLPQLVKEATSLADAIHDVEQLICDDEGQRLLVHWLVKLISPESTRAAIDEWTFRRWAKRDYEPLALFAPYSRHCLKVCLFFHLAYANTLIKTTRSSWIDAEYLCYAPFAQIFSSGDKLHQELASFVLDDDQSFVLRDTFVRELHSLAERRASSATDDSPENVVEPEEESCIYQLHVRHLGAYRPRSIPSPPLTEKKRTKIMRDVAPVFEAIQRDRERVPSQSWTDNWRPSDRE